MTDQNLDLQPEALTKIIAEISYAIYYQQFRLYYCE